MPIFVPVPTGTTQHNAGKCTTKSPLIKLIKLFENIFVLLALARAGARAAKMWSHGAVPV